MIEKAVAELEQMAISEILALVKSRESEVRMCYIAGMLGYLKGRKVEDYPGKVDELLTDSYERGTSMMRAIMLNKAQNQAEATELGCIT